MPKYSSTLEAFEAGNRELRTRVWDLLEEKYLDDAVEDGGYYGGEVVIEQWSGLNDKDGKDLFEGDVCRERRTGKKILIRRNKAGAFVQTQTSAHGSLYDSKIYPEDLTLLGSVREGWGILESESGGKADA